MNKPRMDRLPDPLDQVVAPARARHVGHSKAATIEETPQFQVRVRAVDRVDPPLQRTQALPPRIANSQGREGGQDALAAAIDVPQFEDEPVASHPEPPQDIGRAGTEDEWLTAQDKRLDLFTWQSEELVRSEAPRRSRHGAGTSTSSHQRTCKVSLYSTRSSLGAPIGPIRQEAFAARDG